uniref:C-type lectin domain-containing protein n=1 Tax=Echeneis naucrates TaxID=173247 RepID=A0A665T725_ECHNA
MLFLLDFTASGKPGCPESWLMFSSSCYYISSQRRSWHDSRQDCLQRGADLVIINNRQEQNFLIGFSMVAWIGMTDREMEGTWIWVDGTPCTKNCSTTIRFKWMFLVSMDSVKMIVPVTMPEKSSRNCEKL